MEEKYNYSVGELIKDFKELIVDYAMMKRYENLRVK